MPFEPQRTRDIKLALSSRKQMTFGTALGDALIDERARPTNAEVTQVLKSFRSDIDHIKGDEFAADLQELVRDARRTFAFDLSSWLAAYAAAFGMGKVTSVQPDDVGAPTAWEHTIVFSDPAVSKQVPITTYSEQISTAANLNRKIADAAVNSFNVAGRIGPDAGPMALSIEAIASGIEAAGLATYPALASPEPGLLFNRDVDILLGTEGSPTSIKDRVVEWSVGVGQNLLADQGYFAGSGKFRGRLWHGRRDVNVSLVLFIDGSSDFKDKFDGETKEELKITVTGALIAAAVNHQMTIRLPAIRLPNLAYAEEVGMMTYRIDIGPEGVFRGATLTEPIEFKIINEEASFLGTM